MLIKRDDLAGPPLRHASTSVALRDEVLPVLGERR
jgi:hypothetical protein